MVLDPDKINKLIKIPSTEKCVYWLMQIFPK